MTRDTVVTFRSQKYSILKKQALRSGQKFEDPEFPPNEASLYCQHAPAEGIIWKRPKDLVANPRLCIEGVSSRDVIQGELGNCWLVAACACIAVHKPLWNRVIVNMKEQEWNSQVEHPGIFHFRFWRYGVWIDVVIDDFLPTRKGKLIYLRSPHDNEFWSALLEKAYAKLCGCYESLNGGELAEALEDFTGGISESCNLVTEKRVSDELKRSEFFEWLLRASGNNATMCAAIPPKGASEMEKVNQFGLVIGHAYSITAVRKVRLRGTGIFEIFRREKLSMIRLRNPWGDGEWNGPFSSSSEEWNKIVKCDRVKVGLTFENDGEFWMTFEDFCRHFVNMAICHRINTSVHTSQKRWRQKNINGAWTLPMRAGGCSNFHATFFNNPQYVFNVTETTDELMFHMSQKIGRGQGVEKQTIGFTVMKVEGNRRYRLHSFQPIVGSSPFRNSRSVFWRRTLTKGRYILVACVFQPGITGQFHLRAFAGHNIRFRELLRDKPEKPCLPLCLCCLFPECITRFRVCRAYGLKRCDTTKSTEINSYCVIRCEGETVRSVVFAKSDRPDYNCTAIFYRKNPCQKPITVEIYHRGGPGCKELIGELSYSDHDDMPPTLFRIPLGMKKRGCCTTMCRQAPNVELGRVTVEVTTSHILDLL